MDIQYNISPHIEIKMLKTDKDTIFVIDDGKETIKISANLANKAYKKTNAKDYIKAIVAKAVSSLGSTKARALLDLFLLFKAFLSSVESTSLNLDMSLLPIYFKYFLYCVKTKKEYFPELSQLPNLNYFYSLSEQDAQQLYRVASDLYLELTTYNQNADILRLNRIISEIVQ